MYWGNSEGRWLDADLMASSQSGFQVEAFTGVTVDSSYSIYYVGTGLTIHKMWFQGSQFVDADLMASSQSGYNVQPGSQVTVDANFNIYYVTTAQAVHQMYWGTNQFVDVSIHNSLLVEPGTGVTVDTSGSVYYVDTGQTVHKMYISGGQWVDANIMASAQSASVVVPGGGVAVDGNGNIYYVDPGQTIQEMFWVGTQFADANLMASSGSGLQVSVAFIISGQVTTGGTGYNGVSVTLSGTTPAGTSIAQTTLTSTVFGNDGEYSFLVPDGGSYALAPSDINGDTFQPSISQPLSSLSGSLTLNFTNNGNSGYNPGPYPSDPAGLGAPAGSCNVTGTWADGASGITWNITQNGNSLSGSGTGSVGGCSTPITWTAAGSISGNLVGLTASSPIPSTQACAGFEFTASNPITAAVVLSGCSSGAATETARVQSSGSGFLGGGNGGSATASGSGPFTLASNPITFQISSPSAQPISGITAPVIPMSTGDTNIQVTTTSSLASYNMTSVYSAAFQSNPHSQPCAQGATGGATLSGSATGQGSATGTLTAGPAGCSGIFTIWGNVGGTTTQNTVQVIVPPQVMIQTEVGEAGAQTQAGDDSMVAVLLTARNRFGDTTFTGGRAATWQSVLVPSQYYGASNTTANGLQPELNYAASVFSGASTVDILNCEAYWSPTNAQYGVLQSWENTPANAVSDNAWFNTVGAPVNWRNEPKQAVIKRSIATNRQGANYNSAPALVLFREAPGGTAPAVIIIP